MADVRQNVEEEDMKVDESKEMEKKNVHDIGLDGMLNVTMDTSSEDDDGMIVLDEPVVKKEKKKRYNEPLTINDDDDDGASASARGAPQQPQTRAKPSTSFLFGNDGTQHAGAAHGYHDRACRLSRNTAGFQRDFLVTVLERFFHYIHVFSPNMTRPALGRP